MAYSSLVVEGEILSSSSPFTVETLSGSRINYVDHHVSVSRVLRGDAGCTSFTLRTAGGTVGEFTYANDYSPQVSPGNRYVLFLFQPKIGNGAFTQGDYSFPTGESLGVYQQVSEELAGEALYLNVGKMMVEDNGTESIDLVPSDLAAVGGITEDYISLPTFADTMEAFNLTVPIDEFWWRKESLSNLEANLESGLITPEEYETYYQQIDEFATILLTTNHVANRH